MTDSLERAGGIPQSRKVVTAIPGPRSLELAARRSAAVAPGVTSTLPVYVERAGGGIVVDVDGNSLIDFGAGIAVTSVGNAAPEIVEAVTAQIAAFTHTCFMIGPYENYISVCEELNKRTPGDHDKRSVLFNSGAEAVENAVKIARHYTGRDAVVVFDHGYHGRTNLTMALTAKVMPYKHKFGPFAPEVYRAPMSYPFREPVQMSGEEAATRAIKMIDTQVGADNVAAILIEPVQGEGGFVVPERGFLPALVEYAREKGIVFVADEIQSGMCRTGDWFACDQEGIVPDLVTTAKALAGGMPLAGVTGRAEIVSSVHAGGLGGTYGGNPVTCAAALAAMSIMDSLDLAGAARHIGGLMTPALQEFASRYPVIGEVRGRGAMLAIELVEPGTKVPNAGATQAVMKACHAEGLIVLSCGTYGNVLRFVPPLVIEDELVREGLGILDKALASAS